MEAQRKKEELLAMRDPKALRKIQKSLKVIKSANKSVIEDAVDHEHTAITLAGPDQPDQDDYGYESQEAAALYEKMMQKYSKLPDEPKFSAGRKYIFFRHSLLQPIFMMPGNTTTQCALALIQIYSTNGVATGMIALLQIVNVNNCLGRLYIQWEIVFNKN